MIGGSKLIENISLEELEKYLGKRDTPKDFKEFWNSQIKKVGTITEYKVNKKNFDVEFVDCSDLTFKSLNGSLIYAKYLKPKTKNKVPVLFHFHGYQGRSSDWSEYFKYILAGFAVVAMDVRGQAGQSTDSGIFSGNTVKGQLIRGMTEGRENLFFKEIFLDVYQLIELVANFDEIDEKNMITLGASQGGALAIIGGALNPKINKIISIYPFLSDFKRVLDLKLTCEPYDELFRYFKYTDPLYRTEDSVLKALDYIDVKNFATFIKGDLKLITGLRDEICAPSTQYAFYNRVEGKKEHLILPEYGHEALNVEMNDLIMNWITGGRIGEN